MNNEKIGACPFCGEPHIVNLLGVDGVGFTVSVWICTFCHNVFREEYAGVIRAALASRSQVKILKAQQIAEQTNQHPECETCKHYFLYTTEDNPKGHGNNCLGEVRGAPGILNYCSQHTSIQKVKK